MFREEDSRIWIYFILIGILVRNEYIYECVINLESLDVDYRFIFI